MARSTRTRLTRSLALALATASSVGVAATSAASANADVSTTSSVKTRAQVPWASVGTGWVAADVVRGGVNHLVLASPGGQAYEIATLAKNEVVVAISHDGKHVATQRPNSSDGLPHPRVWDMRTGKASNLPINLSNLTFTRPNGTAVMGFNEVNSYGRYSTSGTQQRVVTAGRSGVGDYPVITPNPNGLTDAVTSTRAGRSSVSLYNHAGFTKARTFSQPTGSQGCTATGWKNTTTLIETCDIRGKNGVAAPQVFAQNIAGGAPKALTSGTYPGGDAYSGFSDAADTSIGTLAMTASPYGGDFGGTVFRLSGTKATTKVGPSSVNPNGGAYAGGYATKIVGDKILYASSPMGGRSTKRMVAEYDVRTKKLTYLVGNNSKYTGEVNGYAVIDPRA
ncbi:hypothetical protein AA983_02685 [Dermacoccus sp. PE3]|uniref:hypothetical protein n=1 Tax=Dermacoccus sp. PE3 TaxID=1641401 RepID=UPI00064254A9|nr:hypothetical protein [Dermacoccus sp. PE3]KLO63690.1 hypothetical protein AA983_02685 [Dermacoccus sp. PE3]